MGMDVGGAKGGVKSDINVTPMVDVMLVLLIIMFIVAPMLQKGVDVRLPLAANTEDKPETQDETVIAISADRRFYVDGSLVREDDLTQRVLDVLEGRREKIIHIKGDEDAPYASVMIAMDRLRAAGIENIGLITERKIRPGEARGE
jgi:biopolymer transport protein TolR